MPAVQNQWFLNVKETEVQIGTKRVSETQEKVRRKREREREREREFSKKEGEGWE